MYEYRQAIYRMRSGQSDRAIAKAGLMGRRKAAELRILAQECGWLDKGPLPTDIELAAYFDKKVVNPPTPSQVLPFAQEINLFIFS